MQHWRLLEYSLNDPAMNLAIEEAVLRSLLEHHGANTIRMWQNPPSVIVGYFQNPETAANLKVCEKLGIGVLKRISGGGAVYHDYGNINYSIFVKKETLETCLKNDLMNLEKSYMVFCSGITEALKDFGIEAQNIKGNIIFNGKKFSGSAQHRLYNVILHHGTVMVNVNMELLGQTLGIPNPEKLLINLYDVFSHEITVDAIKKAIKNGFEKTLNIKLMKGSLTPIEKRIAAELYKIKYSQKWWNKPS